MPTKMTPKQWVDGMALLAEHREKGAHSIAVQVLKRAVLAGPDHKNRTGWSERGDIVLMANGPHIRDLEAKGIITRKIEIPPIPELGG